MDVMNRKTTDEEREVAMVLSRGQDGRFMLSNTKSGKDIKVDECTASKLMLLESFGESEKSLRLASRLIGEEIKSFRLDATLMAEIEDKEKSCFEEESRKRQGSGKEDGKNTVLDAHVTGIGAGGDFHLAARVQNEKTGEVRDMKGMITGLDAALLRSDTNELGKDGTVLRNAQALACENFEKGMMAAFTPNNSVIMKVQ